MNTDVPSIPDEFHGMSGSFRIVDGKRGRVEEPT